MQDAAEGPTLASYDGATLASVSLIWCLVAFNFYVLAVRRHGQQEWNWLSLLVGYGGLVLQALSFYRCRHTNPGTVTDEWVAAATAGTVPASVCPRSGKLVPPGGLYVRRAAAWKESPQPTTAPHAPTIPWRPRAQRLRTYRSRAAGHLSHPGARARVSS